MSLKVCFIERRDATSPSIERVFRSVAEQLRTDGIATEFVKLPFGNSLGGTILNLLFFKIPRADVLHVTGHITYMGLVLPPERTVVTFHDLTILSHRRSLRRQAIKKLYFGWPAKRIKYLTAISDATRHKLAAMAPGLDEKVRVIANPVLVSSCHRGGNVSGTPVILQVGTAPNKNVERLVRAIVGLNCRLRLVGTMTDELRALIDESQVELEHIDYLENEGIEAAYSNADVVTLCSTDEGFGLPIIEAQARGAVVVTSNRPPMSEIAGEGAIKVDPENVNSIRAGVKQALEDAAIRETLVKKGYENIKRFDPQAIAASYLKLYNEILNGE